jgi:hypothetical protein
MPELENPERKQTDEASAILAGYLTPKESAQALGVSERTIARRRHFREAAARRNRPEGLLPQRIRDRVDSILRAP